MSSHLTYLLPIKESTDDSYNFVVKKPSFFKWISVFFVAIAFHAIWFIIIGNSNVPVFMISGVIVIGAIFLWKKIGNFVINFIIIDTLNILSNSVKTDDDSQKVRKEGKLKSFGRKIFLSLLGIKLSEDCIYYVEASIKPLEVKGIKTFIKTKLFELLSSCLGIGFILLSLTRFFVKELEVITVLSAIVMLGSPFLVAWLIPLLWTLEDSGLKYIQKDSNSFSISEQIRKGFLRRFLGYSGFLAGLGFLVDIIPRTEDFPQNVIISTIWVYIIAVLILLLIAVLVSGPAYLIGIIYLTRNHEKQVNKVRNVMKKMLPVAQTNAILDEYKEEETSLINQE